MARTQSLPLGKPPSHEGGRQRRNQQKCNHKDCLSSPPKLWGTHGGHLNTEFYNASRSLLITQKGTLSHIKVAPNAMIPHVYLNKLSGWTGSFEETAKLHNGVQLYANLKSQISIDFYKPKQKSSFSLNPSHERLSTWSIPTNLYSVWIACLGKKKKNQRASFKNSSQR